MAKREVLVCDGDQGACQRNATCYKMWRDGDKQAWTVDLCDIHAEPLLSIVDGAKLVDLPTKQRARMEVTKLRATDRTRDLKT